ncbi:MAG: DUF3276 family protein [Bacteroidales bacterium]|nr:DUF3276 family protein [Bacteroidales bacterium]
MYSKKKDQPEELYSQSISAGKRKYFFDVKQTKAGDMFITIAESRKVFDNETGQFYFDKNKMFLYKEDFEKFQRGLSNAFHYIETGEIPAGEAEPMQAEHNDDIDSVLSDIDNIKI